MPTSAPFAQYVEFPTTPGAKDEVIIKSGVFIDIPITTDLPTDLVYTQKAASLSAQAIHKGDYRTLFNTHQNIKAFCKENGYTLKAQPYEIYLTDPELSPSASNWETLVVYELE